MHSCRLPYDEQSLYGLLTCPWDPPLDPQGPLKVKYGMCSNTVKCGIVAKLTTSRVRICKNNSPATLRLTSKDPGRVTHFIQNNVSYTQILIETQVRV